MIFVRHGQSEFNAAFSDTGRDPKIEDAGLTDLGRRQIVEAGARLLRERPAGPEGLVYILASPYRRTLESADILADILELPIRIDPLIREMAGYSCDVGTPVSRLQRDWPQLDFAHVPEIWWNPPPEPADAVDGRAAQFRAGLDGMEAPGRVLAVSHWGFIRALTGATAENGQLIHFSP